jgi:hypothetical protein
VKPRKPKEPLAEKIPLNFLLTCSDRALGQFELTRLNAVANLRTELHAILDKIIDEMSQAGLAAWFRNQDRESIKHALENPPDIEALAKREIRRRQRSGDEMAADDLLPMPTPTMFQPALPPEKAHLATALRYQERNIAKGLCSECTQPLDRNSVRYCTYHLALARDRMRVKKTQLKALAEANKKRKGGKSQRKNEALLKMLRGEEASEE